MTSELTELQEQLARALRYDRSLGSDAAWIRFADQHISGNDRLSPVEQLEIYREQFWWRHTGSLIEDFPGLGGILGQEDWERLCQQYLREVTPDSYTLRDLGRRLPEVIGHASYLPHQALCLDMAHLELAYIEAFDAPDSAQLDPQRLAAIGEQDLPAARLILAPCVRLLELTYPVADLRRALRAAGEQPVAIPGPDPRRLAVYRRDLRLWDMPLNPASYAFMSALAAGVPLGSAAEAAASTPEAEAELAAQIGSLLQEWTTKGLISDVQLA